MAALDDLVAALGDAAGAVALAEAPPSRQRAVLALARRERVLPTLGWRLVDAGVATAVSGSFAHFLASTRRTATGLDEAVMAYAANTVRTADLAGQLEAITSALNDAGVVWVPLKGAALLLDRVWPQADAREMTDLDLYVPDPDELATAADLLHSLGYVDVPWEVHPGRPVLTDTHQLRAMTLSGHAGSVELHRALLADEHAHHLAPPVLRAGPGDGGARLTQADLARHTIAHARLSDWTARTARPALRSVLDVAWLIEADPRLVAQLTAAGDTRPLRRAVAIQLQAVSALTGEAIPTSLRARLWWQVSRFVTGSSRRDWVWSHLAMLPVFLRPERMAARTHPAHGSRLGLVWRRARQAITERPRR